MKILNRVTEKDIRNLVSEILDSRYAMNEALKEMSYNFYLYLSLFLCCCCCRKNKY